MNIQDLLNEIKEYNNDYRMKNVSKGKSTQFVDERIMEFSNIENYLQSNDVGHLQTIMIAIKQKAESNAQMTLYNLGINNEIFFNQLVKEDFCNLASIYLLMLKKDSKKTLSIPDQLVPIILAKAMRGVRYFKFDRLIAIISDPIVVKLMINDQFLMPNASRHISANELAMSSLSRDIDATEYEYQADKLPIYLHDFLKNKISPEFFEELVQMGLISKEIKANENKTNLI